MAATINLYQNDIPANLNLGPSVAVDTETMGLNLTRDRLCLVQLSAGDGDCHMVQFANRDYDAPNLRALLSDRQTTKLFHFARFDLAMLQKHLDVDVAPVFCTKVASRLVRTFTDRHGLRDLCKDLLGIELSKQQQSTDWGAPELAEEQLQYAANDVVHLHALREKLDALLWREERMSLATACFDFLPWRAKLDLAGWNDVDIFAHS